MHNPIHKTISNFILSSRERKEPRGDAAAATVCGPVPSPPASLPVVTRSGGPSFQQIAYLRRVLVEST